MTGDAVLVTGGSGFIAAHCILRLQRDGYRVRTTVRSPARERYALEELLEGGGDPGAELAFFEADLLGDDGWVDAVQSCRYVLHVASPFPLASPRHEDDLIVPAREGTLRVLRAARDAGVERVVVTSSFAAIGYGHAPADRPFTEADWTDLSAPLSPYVKSKTVAERAAWDFVASEPDAPELATVNPVGVFGPVLGPDYSTSIELVSRLMSGGVPAMPRLHYNVVDVRDVADLHVMAMTAPEAAGERFLAVAGEPMSFRDVAEVLRANMGEAARRVPTRELPDWVIRFAAVFSGTVRQTVPDLGVIRRASGAKARTVLGWEPRSNEEVILATAESLVRLGIVRV